MVESIFDYRDYKKYISDLFEGQPKRGRGFKSGLAKALRCPNSHITQVLKGNSHFTPEQAEAASRHLSLQPEEARYFVLMVLHERSGTSQLRDFLRTQMNEAIERHLNLRTIAAGSVRLQELSDQVTMYNHWYYSAIHVAVSIPGIQTVEDLTRHLRISKRKVVEALEFLESRGLVKREGGHYRMGETSIHLDATSPMIVKHHSNWRLKAIESLEHPSTEDFHYSSVVSLSHDDVHKIKSILAKAIERCRAVVKPSPAERLQSLSVDYFEIKK